MTDQQGHEPRIAWLDEIHEWKPRERQADTSGLDDPALWAGKRYVPRKIAAQMIRRQLADVIRTTTRWAWLTARLKTRRLLDR